MLYNIIIIDYLEELAFVRRRHNKINVLTWRQRNGSNIRGTHWKLDTPPTVSIGVATLTQQMNPCACTQLTEAFYTYILLDMWGKGKRRCNIADYNRLHSMSEVPGPLGVPEAICQVHFIVNKYVM